MRIKQKVVGNIFNSGYLSDDKKKRVKKELKEYMEKNNLVKIDIALCVDEDKKFNEYKGVNK